MTFKKLKETKPLNDYPTGEALFELIRELRDTEGELEGGLPLVRRAKTNGYNAALSELLERIDEHRYGITPITAKEEK